MPAYLPACDGVELLTKELEFSWPGIEGVKKSVEKLEYYQCQDSYRQVADSYREQMTDSPYDWVEVAWVDREEGILGEYYHMVYESWFYVWFLPEGPSVPGSYLAAAWVEGDIPLDMPCH